MNGAGMFSDRYSFGLEAAQVHFCWNRCFEGKTEFGFKLQYRIRCHVDKVNKEEFKAARMLEEESQQVLLNDWHRDIFLPKFKELRCSFRFLRFLDIGEPALCRLVREGGADVSYFDFNCFQTRNDLLDVSYLKNGCTVKIAGMDLEIDEATIRENYNMLKLQDNYTGELTENFKRWEEATIVAMLSRQLDLEQSFQSAHCRQEHKSDRISIMIRQVGSGVEISWKFKNKDDYVLKGFRSENGFREGGSEHNGICVIESGASEGKALQNLYEGKEYFFTMLLTTEEPVYRDEGVEDVVRNIIGAKVVKRTETVTVDSLRFTVRMPTVAEKRRVEQMIENLQKKMKPSDPDRQNLMEAVRTLNSFVEFDEVLWKVQTELANRIKIGNHSEAIKRDMIDRLTSVAESLRVKKGPLRGGPW